MNFAIIVAAGNGTRFGTKTPKQFLELNRKPLIIHTLERFENCPQIDQIILVLSSTETQNFLNLAKKYNLKKLAKIAAGGKTRAASVFNGLKTIRAVGETIVAVHDGARPLVTSAEIAATVEKAATDGAACLVARITDTIKKVSDGKIIETIDRLLLRRALTPQCFQYDILKRAFENADLSEAATDECFLVEKAGYKISTVEGNARNIKITHPEDLALAEFLLRQTDDN
ncbi:MAG: 2-C-methyl-D-erythritol 4-phosphate cytidylyltransferase [Pyrinomonadaceae bacterium]